VRFDPAFRTLSWRVPPDTHSPIRASQRQAWALDNAIADYCMSKIFACRTRGPSAIIRDEIGFVYSGAWSTVVNRRGTSIRTISGMIGLSSTLLAALSIAAIAGNACLCRALRDRALSR
jgi:hypothetical protein